MISGFPRRRQQTRGSCLPTAVWCVLEHWGRTDLKMDQVADLCHVGPGGFCAWDITLAELERQFDIDDLEGDWEGIVEAVETNEEPVIATIANPFASLTGDHAVVIIGIGETEGGEDQVTYMDPLTGNNQRESLRYFRLWWDAPGERAFVLRP